MATCTSTRVDHLDFTDNVSAGPDIGCSVPDTSRSKIYFCYAEQAVVGDVNNGDPHCIYFREYDPVAATFLSAVEVHKVVTPSEVYRPEMVRLTDGTLVMVWSFYDSAAGNYRTRASESAAGSNGAVWGSVATLDTVGRQFAWMCTDGVNVYAFSYMEGSGSGTPGGRELYCFKRTSAGAWAAGVLVYDGAGTNDGELIRNGIGADREAIAWTANSVNYVLVVAAHFTGASSFKVAALLSIDGGASWTEYTVRDYGTVTSVPDCVVSVLRGTDSRIRAMWNDYQGGVTADVPYLAFSDTNGTTWSMIGTPSVLAAVVTGGILYGWKARNKGFALGSDNVMYASVLYGSGSAWTYYIFRGGDSLAGWEIFHTCTYTGNLGTGSVRCDALFYGNDYYYLFNETSAGAHNEVRFLAEADIPIGGGGPPLVEEASSGFDVSNQYLRLQVAEQRGWGLHDLEVSCWSPWGEGTYLSQRRDHVLLAGAAVIDPTTGDPADLPAIWQVDNRERYTKETFISDGTNIIPRGDPFRFYWKSRGVELNDKFGQGVLRGFVFRYRRTGAAFTVNVLVDNATCMTQSMRASLASMDDIIEVFIPARTDDNVGTYVQLEIDDETEYPLIIEGFVPVRIKKGLRG